MALLPMKWSDRPLNFSSFPQSKPESFFSAAALRSSKRREKVLQTTFLALLFVFQHEDLLETSEWWRFHTAGLWWWRWAGVWRCWPWCAAGCSVCHRFGSGPVDCLWCSVFACASRRTFVFWKGHQKLPVHSRLSGHFITGVTGRHHSIGGSFKLLQDCSLFSAESLSCRLSLQKSSDPRRGLPLGPQTHVMIAQFPPLETEGADYRLRQCSGSALMPLQEKARLFRANVFVQ